MDPNDRRRKNLVVTKAGIEIHKKVSKLRTKVFAQVLAATQGPIVAASDYVSAVPELLRAHLPAGRSYRTLGTDGFGCSDTRSALRRHFGIDAEGIAAAAKSCLPQR